MMIYFYFFLIAFSIPTSVILLLISPPSISFFAGRLKEFKVIYNNEKQIAGIIKCIKECTSLQQRQSGSKWHEFFTKNGDNPIDIAFPFKRKMLTGDFFKINELFTYLVFPVQIQMFRGGKRYFLIPFWKLHTIKRIKNNIYRIKHPKKKLG